MNIGSLPPALSSQCTLPATLSMDKAPALSSGVQQLFQAPTGSQQMLGMPASGFSTSSLMMPLTYLSQAVNSLADTVRGLAGGFSFGSPGSGFIGSGIMAQSQPASDSFSLSNVLGLLGGGSWIDVASGLVGNLFQNVDIGEIFGSLSGGVRNFFNKLF